jgi:hypothetical protein
MSTTSQHYAFLALEAALQVRWSATLPKDTIVEFGSGRAFTLGNRLYGECPLRMSLSIRGSPSCRRSNSTWHDDGGLHI